MKLALICTEKLPIPPIAGGAVQQYIEGILPYLCKHHDVTVYSISYSGLPNFENVNRVKYVRLPATDNQEYLNNLKNSVSEDFDLIYVFNRPAWIVDLGDRFPNSKFALSVHNEMFAQQKLSFENADKCIKRVEFINTVSKFIADGIRILYPQAEGKLNVVYSAADPNKYAESWSNEGMVNRHTVKRKFHIENYKVVLYIGRLSEKKGPHILMQALKPLMNYRNDIALIIVGSKWYGENNIDNYTKTLYALAKELSGPVVFTGFLTPSEILPLYNAADIFVCPSQWSEPLARVHYEAMAAGLPIITTNRGGNAEVVTGFGNGIVINDYTNPEQFAYCINYLLSNPYIAFEMGKSGRRLIEDRFNWERVAKEILTKLDNVK